VPTVIIFILWIPNLNIISSKNILDINILFGYSKVLNKYFILLPFSFCIISVIVNLISCSGRFSNLQQYFSNIVPFIGKSSCNTISLIFFTFLSFIVGSGCVSGCGSGCVSGCGSVCVSGCGSGCVSCCVSILGPCSVNTTFLISIISCIVPVNISKSCTVICLYLFFVFVVLYGPIKILNLVFICSTLYNFKVASKDGLLK
jgi:hypothetical protein